MSSQHKGSNDLARIAPIYVSNVREFLGFPIGVKLFFNGLVLCFLLVGVKTDVNRDISSVVFSFLLVLLSCFLIWVDCFLGEYLQSQSNILFYEICELEWYRQGSVTQKMLVMMLRQLEQPLVIHYKRKYALTFQTGMGVLNACYSFFMLFNSLD